MADAGKKKSKEIASPKGTRDILDEEHYSFQELFESGIGRGTDIVDKEMYTLRTRGGDHLALRPEHTAPLLRAYIEHGMQNLPQPVLYYQYGPIFRHDSPQRGRYRQFWQFDLDSLGSDKR